MVYYKRGKMVRKELVDYIKKEFAKGVNRSNIEKALIRGGWPAAFVEEAFKETLNKPNSRKKKFVLVFIGLFVILIVFLGALGMWLMNAKTEKDGDIQPPIQQIKIEEPKQEVLSNKVCLSLSTDNISHCDEDGAEDINNTSPLEYKVHCHNEYYYAKAIMVGDASLCTNIDEMESFMKYVCLASINSDSGICQSIQMEEDRISCEAVVAQDSSKCNIISDKELKEECSSAVARDLAYRTKDISNCNKIAEGTYPEKIRADCIAAINKDPSVCIHRNIS